MQKGVDVNVAQTLGKQSKRPSGNQRRYESGVIENEKDIKGDGAVEEARRS